MHLRDIYFFAVERPELYVLAALAVAACLWLVTIYAWPGRRHPTPRAALSLAITLGFVLLAAAPQTFFRGSREPIVLVTPGAPGVEATGWILPGDEVVAIDAGTATRPLSSTTTAWRPTRNGVREIRVSWSAAPRQAPAYRRFPAIDVDPQRLLVQTLASRSGDADDELERAVAEAFAAAHAYDVAVTSVERIKEWSSP